MFSWGGNFWVEMNVFWSVRYNLFLPKIKIVNVNIIMLKYLCLFQNKQDQKFIKQKNQLTSIMNLLAMPFHSHVIISSDAINSMFA